MTNTDGEPPLLQLQNVSCTFKSGHPLFQGVNLTVNKGDVIAVVGRSGGGKTTLLKCISHMILYEGSILLHGKKPADHQIPSYRTKVLYVPQRPSLLPGTPRTFIQQVRSYASRKNEENNEQAAIELGDSWGLDRDLWDRPWPSLSGGEAQRAVLAVACTLKNTEILLLDEPTSALDANTVHIVEDHLASLPGKPDHHIQAIFWITHSDEQRKKATRLIRVAGGVEEEEVPGDV